MVSQRLDQFSDGVTAALFLSLGDFLLSNIDQLSSRCLLVHSFDRCEQGVSHLAELHSRLVERINRQLDTGALHFGSPGPATGHSVLVGATLGGHRLTRRAVDHSKVAAGRTLRQGGYIGDNLRRGFNLRSLSTVPGVLQCWAELHLQVGRPPRRAPNSGEDRFGRQISKGFKNTPCRLLGRRTFSDAGLRGYRLNELSDSVGDFGDGVA